MQTWLWVRPGAARAIGLAFALLGLVACGGGSAGDGGAADADVRRDTTPGSDIQWRPPLTDIQNPGDTGGEFDTKLVDAVDTVVAADADTVGEPDVGICGPSSPLFGPCESNEDCPDGLCVWDPAGERFVCTVTCVETCPCGWQCRTVAGTWPEAASVCLPPMDRLCQPCNEPDDCVNPSDLCLPIGTDPAQPTFCSKGCALTGQCPAGYTCADVEDEAGEVIARQCLPDSGSCVCTAELVGNTRACQTTNDYGTCAGSQTCEGAAGWSACDAPEPLPETCNGDDDDCDGDVDEGFVWTASDEQEIPIGEPCGTGRCAGGVVICADEASATCSGLSQQAEEVCNQIDDDCNGETDEFVALVVYQDQDLDGQGWIGIAQTACQESEGWVANADDCDDYDISTGLGFPEKCDNRDNDCDGTTDDDIYYASPTGAQLGIREPCGVGLCRGGIVICSGEDSLDCSTGGYAEEETCDGRDEDCDGVTDNTCDDDEDGYCDTGVLVAGTPGVCPEGPGDCDDDDPDIHPDADELCDGVDQDCDGETDEDFVDCQGQRCVGEGDDYFETSSSSCEAGNCVAPDPRSCRLYTCVDGGAAGDVCALTCVDDSTCVTSAHCDKDNRSCVPDVADGGACQADNECASGHCRGGFCCASGDCCATAEDCGAPYARAAVCDDETTCQGHRGAASCVDFVCGEGPDVDDDSACGTAIQAVDCSPNAPLHCTGEADQTPPLCSDICTLDADCVDGWHCDDRCLPDRPDGGPCDEASDCVSGHCQNGYCCGAGDCCALAEDCPRVYGDLPVCEFTLTCQGFRTDPVCGADHACSTSERIADDSGCDEETVSDECGPYRSVFCNGTFDQVPPECPWSCEADAECDDGAHCDGTCEYDLEDGAACDEDNDCQSEHCANGFCCGGGVCCGEPVDCPVDFRDAPVCDDAATCQGHRIDATCIDSVCGRSSRVDDDSACGAGVLSDPCGYYPDRYCSGEAYQTPASCPNTCTQDDQCDANAHCDGTCIADVPDGQPCDEYSDCVSGFCQNGFCCGAGDCCATGSDCPDGYAALAVCDDPATCQGHRVDARCQSFTCVAVDVPDDSACGVGTLSDDCGRFLPVFCSGAVDQTDPGCPTTCTVDGQCDPGAHCEGACVDDSGNGGACDENSDCSSGHCQNGYCCDYGDCCATAANCPATYGSPPICNSPATCQGTRVSPTCASNRCGSQQVDDDSGCAGTLNDTCGPYPSVYCTSAVSQSDPACPATCGSDNDCDPSAHCDGGRCITDLGRGEACDEPSDCESGLYCVDGVCCNSSCTGTCAACDVEGHVGTCTSVPSGQDPDSECGAVSCTNYYWGWLDRTCYRRANMAAGVAGCDGTGQCQDAADVCPGQGQGTAAIICPAPCKAPNSGLTCTGMTAGTCVNQNPGSISCGTGACYREVTQCVNGVENTCTPGTGSTETCDNIDNDCDGDTDEGISSAIDQYETHNTCATRYDLGNIAEESSEVSWSATIYPRNDEDWYRVNLVEASHTCFPLSDQDYTIRVRLVPPGGADCVDYDVYLYEDDCTTQRGVGYSSGCTAESFTYTWDGECGFSDDHVFRILVKGFSGASECKPYTLYVDMWQN